MSLVNAAATLRSVHSPGGGRGRNEDKVGNEEMRWGGKGEGEEGIRSLYLRQYGGKMHQCMNVRWDGKEGVG